MQKSRKTTSSISSTSTSPYILPSESSAIARSSAWTSTGNSEVTKRRSEALQRRSSSRCRARVISGASSATAVACPTACESSARSSSIPSRVAHEIHRTERSSASRCSEAASSGFSRSAIFPCDTASPELRSCLFSTTMRWPFCTSRPSPSSSSKISVSEISCDHLQFPARGWPKPASSSSNDSCASFSAAAVMSPRSSTTARGSSSASARTDPSKTRTRMSAAVQEAAERFMPSDSISSPGVTRSPAVSSTVTGSPPRSSRTWTMSRVVPGTAETIAASRAARMFSSDDFPALGGPTSEQRRPARMASPRRPSARCFSICRETLRASSRTGVSTSSSSSPSLSP
mmetsp:Transcript_4889/g.11747  ORF Transcript_4889/g.11747 Transcript_4889/m.11747 type:complete len:345 (+) Transcript_4889:73-1107(+)